MNAMIRRIILIRSIEKAKIATTVIKTMISIMVVIMSNF